MTSHDGQSYPEDGRTILKKKVFFRKFLDHMSSYLIMSYHMTSYDIIWYNGWNSNLFPRVWLWPKSKIQFFFKIVWPCWGYVWVSWLVILRPSKNWKFWKFYFFQKLFIDLWDIIWHHHWVFLARKLIFLKISKNIFQNLFFCIFFFIFWYL